MNETNTLVNAQQGIRILYAEKERASSGGSFGPVIRSVYILECCTGGKGHIIINGQRFPIQEGCCYALLPGDAVTHYNDTEHPRQGFSCMLEGDYVGRVLKMLGIASETPFFPKEQYPQFRDWMEQLLTQWNCTDSGASLRQLSCLYGLLGELLSGHSRPLGDTVVDRAVGYMQANYPKVLTVDDIAAQVGLERTYFSEQFKKRTGLSPYHYLIRVRLQHALELLDTRRYSITEAAYMVGMDPHNFARLFKKEVGCTPQVYVRHVKSGHHPMSGRQKKCASE